MIAENSYNLNKTYADAVNSGMFSFDEVRAMNAVAFMEAEQRAKRDVDNKVDVGAVRDLMRDGCIDKDEARSLLGYRDDDAVVEDEREDDEAEVKKDEEHDEDETREDDATEGDNGKDADEDREDEDHDEGEDDE